MKLTYRQLAARFAEAVGEGAAVTELAQVTIELAREFGLNDTAALIAAIEQELLNRYGIAEVAVTTAHKLNATQLAELSKSMAKAVGAQQVSIVATEDPDLIGGFEATAAGYAIHGSIQSTVSTLKTVGAQHG